MIIMAFSLLSLLGAFWLSGSLESKIKEAENKHISEIRERKNLVLVPKIEELILNEFSTSFIWFK